MNEVSFVEQREPDWKRLSYLSDRADVSPVNLTAAELQELIRLYRKVSTDLALARTKSSNLQLIDFLNDLVAKAYSTLYRNPRKRFGKAIADSVALAARTVRKMKYYVLASALVFVLGILFAGFGSALNPSLREAFEPEELKPAFEQWKRSDTEERNAQESVMMTGFYSFNNPRTAIVEGSIAAGTFGIGSAFVLWKNGTILGALGYEVSTVGKLGHLVIWVMPHGVTELSGLILSGAAGFRLGIALIAPGRRRRSQALKESGGDALVVLCTAVVLMFMAAPVEGFFSFNPAIPDFAKILFAAFAATAWAIFWIGYGREETEPAS